MKKSPLLCSALAGLILAGISTLSAADAPTGIKPLGADGRALNLDFEAGSLKDWQAEGKAFQRQPVLGDTVNARRSDMKSHHTGDYWVGSFEIDGDAAQGTLTSAPFKVTQPFASFLLAGGSHEETRAELVLKENNKAFFKISAKDTEDLRPVIVDLKGVQGKEIYIRLVDQHSGGWGHVNFDDFKFFAAKPEFANALNPSGKPAEEMPPADAVLNAGLSPEEAAKAITMPAGFKAFSFVGEPDVQQPIAFAIDHRGRLWVAEGYTYPLRAPEGQGRDRVLIFEDTDGDHKFDKRTVFIEKLNLVSGLEVGFGGVWVGAAPYLMFIPDRNGDDKPDSEPQIVLDGWAYQDTHETLNTFAWGPDGWLYGCHGIFTHSNVGKPGATDKDRTRINAGIWRYHPTKRTFEVFAEGSSNPWGVDFDEYGQIVIEACVIPHLFHMIQGGRYHRQAGQHFNPHIYEDIKTIADHVHYAGNKGPHAGNNRSDAAGGGHAHAGLMMYLGDSWPQEYRNKAFMNNIHGQRLNMDILEPQGSGFVGKHGPDFLNFNDRWSQVLNFLYDQNGSVYIIDWYDKNQCHHNNVDGHDRSNGRIFKIVYGDTKWTPVNLENASDDELVKYQLHKNDWYVRHARRILQERGPNPKVHAALKEILKKNTDPTRQVRALWALHSTGGLTEEIALAALKKENHYVRAWAIQSLCEDQKPSAAALAAFAQLAKNDPSPVVRLYLASAMQRTPVTQRIPVLEGLLSHAEDVNDHNLPLMYWYATEGVVGADPKAGIALLSKSKIPLVRQYITRRMTSGSKPTASAE